MSKAANPKVWGLPLRSDGQRYSKAPITAPTAIARSVNSTSQITLTASGGSSGLGSNAGYRYRRNGVLLNQSPTEAPYADTGLAANTSYSYTATLIDSAGNESESSASFNATTASSADVTAPTVPVIAAQSLSQNSIRITLVTPSTDSGSGLRDYTLQTSSTASGPWTALQTNVQTGVFPYTNTGLAASTIRYYRLQAFDVAGNSSTSVVVNATTQSAAGGFPLTVSSRKLLKQDGTAFFLNGDTAWSAIVQLTDSEWTQYLDDRQTRGFNTILLNLIEHHFGDVAPNMVQGSIAPFTTPNDIRTPNAAYFDRAVTMIAAASSRGLLVVMTPAYFGFEAGSEGWYTSALATRTPTEVQAFGAYLGTKFAGLNNIVWMPGGDWYNASALTRIQALVTGLKSTGPASWLYTYHAAPGQSSADVVNGESWLTLNATYQQAVASLATSLATDYGRSTVRPFFLLESTYEQESSVSRQVLRQQAYISVLTGGLGAIFGNNPIWHFEAPNPLFSFSGTWQSNLGSNGALDRTVFKNFFTGFAWDQLVPDRTAAVLTAGAGTGAATAYAARMSNGTRIVVYTPSQKALTIALSQLSGASSTATWLNPQTGATTSAGSFGVTGTQAFTPPSAGDWVLILDAVQGTLFLNDNFNDRVASTSSNVTMTSLWTSKGYQGVTAGDVKILDRANVPAGLLADSRVPAGKTRFLRCVLTSSEVESRITWNGLAGQGQRTVWFSWWEYRPNRNLGGEKFCRIGNRLSNGNVGHDIVWCLGSPSGTVTLISNSGQMHQYADIGFGNVFSPWPQEGGGLSHFEIGVFLPANTSATGWSQVWKDGVLVANAQNIQMNNDATQAARTIDKFDLGGWSSTGGGINPGFTYPITRYFLDARVATTRQGVWPIS